FKFNSFSFLCAVHIHKDFKICHCLRTLSWLFIMRCCFLSAGSSFLFVNTSGRYGGQRAQLLLPPLRENDTHCLSFLFYQIGGREGAVPATLNVYIKENSSPLGVPVFNSSGPAYHIWKGVELAVSTFWPNHYEVNHPNANTIE
uniref:MAM domain-containing protein n=1 Tax=Haplochromis burtoni TaxID=8153 RepID=A0A3Q2VMM9_HAPBU